MNEYRSDSNRNGGIPDQLLLRMEMTSSPASPAIISSHRHEDVRMAEPYHLFAGMKGPNAIMDDSFDDGNRASLLAIGAMVDHQQQISLQQQSDQALFAATGRVNQARTNGSWPRPASGALFVDTESYSQHFLLKAEKQQQEDCVMFLNIPRDQLMAQQLEHQQEQRQQQEFQLQQQQLQLQLQQQQEQIQQQFHQLQQMQNQQSPIYSPPPMSRPSMSLPRPASTERSGGDVSSLIGDIFSGAIPRSNSTAAISQTLASPHQSRAAPPLPPPIVVMSSPMMRNPALDYSTSPIFSPMAPSVELAPTQNSLMANHVNFQQAAAALVSRLTPNERFTLAQAAVSGITPSPFLAATDYVSTTTSTSQLGSPTQMVSGIPIPPPPNLATVISGASQQCPPSANSSISFSNLGLPSASHDIQMPAFNYDAFSNTNSKIADFPTRGGLPGEVLIVDSSRMSSPSGNSADRNELVSPLLSAPPAAPTPSLLAPTPPLLTPTPPTSAKLERFPELAAKAAAAMDFSRGPSLPPVATFHEYLPQGVTSVQLRSSVPSSAHESVASPQQQSAGGISLTHDSTYDHIRWRVPRSKRSSGKFTNRDDEDEQEDDAMSTLSDDENALESKHLPEDADPSVASALAALKVESSQLTGQYLEHSPARADMPHQQADYATRPASQDVTQRCYVFVNETHSMAQTDSYAAPGPLKPNGTPKPLLSDIPRTSESSAMDLGRPSIATSQSPSLQQPSCGGTHAVGAPCIACGFRKILRSVSKLKPTKSSAARGANPDLPMQENFHTLSSSNEAQLASSPTSAGRLGSGPRRFEQSVVSDDESDDSDSAKGPKASGLLQHRPSLRRSKSLSELRGPELLPSALLGSGPLSAGGAFAASSQAPMAAIPFSPPSTADALTASASALTEPGEKDRPYVCAVCERRFMRKHDLRRHSLIHDGAAPTTRCDVCFKTFTRVDALHRHIKGKRCKGPPV